MCSRGVRAPLIRPLFIGGFALRNNCVGIHLVPSSKDLASRLKMPDLSAFVRQYKLNSIYNPSAAAKLTLPESGIGAQRKLDILHKRRNVRRPGLPTSLKVLIPNRAHDLNLNCRSSCVPSLAAAIVSLRIAFGNETSHQREKRSRGRMLG